MSTARVSWYRRKQARDLALVACFLLPSLVIFFLYRILPLGWNTVLSFQFWSPLRPARFAGFEHYTEMFVYDDVFWTALGNPPRPAFYVIVTIAMDMEVQTPEGLPVVMKEVILKGKTPPGVPEPVLGTVFQIGGTVRELGTPNPMPNATATLVELSRATTTCANGEFTFDNLAEGNYTLRVSASGFATKNAPIAVPSTVLNEYDVDLAP